MKRRDAPRGELIGGGIQPPHQHAGRGEEKRAVRRHDEIVGCEGNGPLFHRGRGPYRGGGWDTKTDDHDNDENTHQDRNARRSSHHSPVEMMFSLHSIASSRWQFPASVSIPRKNPLGFPNVDGPASRYGPRGGTVRLTAKERILVHLLETRSAEEPSEAPRGRSEEHTSELQSRLHLVCRLLLEKKKKNKTKHVLGLVCRKT